MGMVRLKYVRNVEKQSIFSQEKIRESVQSVEVSFPTLGQKIKREVTYVSAKSE